MSDSAHGLMSCKVQLSALKSSESGKDDTLYHCITRLEHNIILLEISILILHFILIFSLSFALPNYISWKQLEFKKIWK